MAHTGARLGEPADDAGLAMEKRVEDGRPVERLGRVLGGPGDEDEAAPGRAPGGRPRARLHAHRVADDTSRSRRHRRARRRGRGRSAASRRRRCEVLGAAAGGAGEAGPRPWPRVSGRRSGAPARGGGRSCPSRRRCTTSRWRRAGASGPSGSVRVHDGGAVVGDDPALLGEQGVARVGCGGGSQGWSGWVGHGLLTGRQAKFSLRSSARAAKITPM